MANIFKPINIKIDNNDEKVLEKKPLKDIFKFNSTPYICVAMSGRGKTTLAIDLIYTFAKQCANVYYITSTKESITDDSIGLIPKAFRREPTLENIMNVWDEIVAKNEAMNAASEKINEIIIKMYGESVVKQLNKLIDIQKQKIIARNTKFYKSNGVKREDIQNYIKNDALAFVYEIKRRVVLFGLKDIPNMNEKLTIEQTNIINSFVSKPSKTLLILDDITSELNRIKADTNKILYKDNYLSKSKIFQAIMTDILTKARHYNAIVVFFVHTIDIFEQRDNIDRLIMFDTSTSQKINNIRTFTPSMRKLINIASDKLFNSNYKHYFLSYWREGDQICVGKAQLHNGEQINLSEESETFLKLYDMVLSGFKDVTNEENIEEINDNSDSEEPTNDNEQNNNEQNNNDNNDEYEFI